MQREKTKFLAKKNPMHGQLEGGGLGPPAPSCLRHCIH